jgi:ligand-binding sensor domain-containing protein
MSRFRTGLLVAFLLFGLGPGRAVRLAAQSPPFAVEQFTMDDGLPSNEIHSVFQDRYGFLWLATNNGLVRYDGFTFTTFNPEPGDPHSLGGRWISQVAEDPQGNLWVATQAGGLNRLDRTTGRFTRYRYGPEDPNAPSGDLLFEIEQGPGGELWVRSEGGLDRMDTETGLLVHYQLDFQHGTAGAEFPSGFALADLLVDRGGRSGWEPAPGTIPGLRSAGRRFTASTGRAGGSPGIRWSTRQPPPPPR